MKSLSLKTLHLLKPALAAVIMASLAGSPALAGGGGMGNPNPGILPPSSNPFGMSYGQWGDAWVRWAYSIPTDQNPIVALTGEHASAGQSGKVWFLAGSFGVAAERTITVPQGKALFFPIAEWAWVNTPEFGDNPWSPTQEAYARGLIAAGVDDFVNLSCQIDGQAVANLNAYRFQTPPGQAYMVAFPDNNVWGIPAGTYGPSVDDGYWLMLAPLSNGQHTIHFTAGQGGNPDFNLDVTYHITVGSEHP